MKCLIAMLACMTMAMNALALPKMSSVSAKVTGSSSYARLLVSYKISDTDPNPDLSSRYVQARIFKNKAEAQEWCDTIRRNYPKGQAVPCGDMSFEFNLYDEDDVRNGVHSFAVDLIDNYGLSAREFKYEYPTAYLAFAVFDDELEASSSQIAAITYDMSVVSEMARLLYSKSQTVTGVCWSDELDSYYGTVSLKLGKINTKTGVVKVSATITSFVGSKKVSAVANMEADEEGYLYGVLPFKTPVGEIEISIWGDYWTDDRNRVYTEIWFEGWGDGYSIYSAEVGGPLDTNLLYCYSEGGWDEIDFGDCWYVIAALEDAQIYVSRGTKWSFEKAPTLKYVRYRDDGVVWYELEGLDDEEMPNVSGLKLTYTSKTGVFKGSYYIYITNEDCLDCGVKPTLKKIKVTVSGIVIEGYGYGTASAKFGPNTYTWPIFIKDGGYQWCDAQ